MDLDVKESGNVCTLKLKGKLIIGEPVDQFESAFQSALASGHVYLIVDLEEVPFLDSCGIGAIVNSLRLSTKAGGEVLAGESRLIRCQDPQNGGRPRSVRRL